MLDRNVGLYDKGGSYEVVSNFYYGKVIENNDPSGSKRLKVRIKGVDDKTPDANLPWCISFLPLNISLSPQVGEMVKVFVQNNNDINNKREWLGTVTSNFDSLDYESYNNALNNSQLSNKEIGRKNNNKVFNITDFAINGRDNVDILLKPKELELRVGKHNVTDKNTLNTKNPSTLRMKISDDGSRSDTSLVSDKILLITNEGRFNFNKVLNDAEVNKIIESAYSATYAEPLIDFLKLVQNFCVNHIHSSSNLPPNNGTGGVPNIADFDIDSIKAQNIKIN